MNPIFFNCRVFCMIFFMSIFFKNILEMSKYTDVGGGGGGGGGSSIKYIPVRN